MLLAEIKATFRSIDTNGDGRLSIKEFKEAANKMGQNVTTKQVKEMFKLVDDNGEQFYVYNALLKGNQFYTFFSPLLNLEFWPPLKI